MNSRSIFRLKTKHFPLLALILVHIQFSCSSPQPRAQTNNARSLDSLGLVHSLIAANPYADSLYLQRANLYFQRQLLDSSIADLNKAIFLDSLNKDYYLYLSDVYLANAQSKSAKEILDRALALFPDNVEVLLKIARLQLILQQHIQAMTVMDKVFMIDPQNAKAYYLAGHLLYEMGDTTKAISSYQKATDFDPELVEAWIQLGDLYTEKNNPRAIQYYDNAIRIHPDDVETLHNKAYALQKFNRVQESIELYRQICDRFPQYEPAFYNLGILFKSEDSLDAAIKQFSRAIELNPAESSNYFHRAQAYILQNNKTAAREDLLKCTSLNPTDNEAKELLLTTEK